MMDTSIAWLRRDLRLNDNVALFEACRRSRHVCVAFVLDPQLLQSDRVGAPIVQAFFGALAGLRTRLRELGSDLALVHGDAAAALATLARRTGASAVFYNEDYAPEAIARDLKVGSILRSDGILIEPHLDHVYFGANDIDQQNGAPYKVFTPYKNRWLDQRQLAPRPPVPSAEAFAGKALPMQRIGDTLEVPRPEGYGHISSPSYPQTSELLARKCLVDFLAPGGPVERYKDARNTPALDGTSHISVHLRAGTIGIRECVERAFACSQQRHGPARASVQTWISQLIWRDFYQMILRRYPRVATHAFLESGNQIAWRDSEGDYQAWCQGATGYPLVDAAMQQLTTTGWMHNRLRMVVASFLTKDLLLDWRLGERYFEQQLADADMAQNNGGWQWAASTGTDAAPYFRIFNPIRQSKLFDPDGAFIRSMLPVLRDVPSRYIHEPWRMPPALQTETGCRIGREYPAPIVDHAFARTRALSVLAPAFSRHATPAAEPSRRAP